jgi:N-acetylglucosaminyl-diphospho-decaprenol L-rhamnosyltransferase
VSVALIVVTYNSAELLPDFFAALPAALDGVDGYEVIVADNASADATLAVARECWPEATIVARDTNGGYSAGINSGLAAMEPGSHALILNDDIRLGPGSVRLLVDALGDGVGITVPRLVDGEGRLLHNLRREPSIGRALGEALLGRHAGRWSATGEIVGDPAEYERSRTADWASGCAWLISAECLAEVGPWDESLFLYAEDTEYALRARDHGFTLLFVPEAHAVHLVGPSHRNPRLWAMSVWNRYRLYRRRHGAVPSFFFRTSLALGEALRALAGRKVHRAGLAALLFASARPEEVR